MELMKPDMKECQDYFNNRGVYGKLFSKMRGKYESLGHFGGKVVLSGLTAEEKTQLGGFLQRDFTESKSVTISLARLQKALNSSRFAGLRWEEIIEEYFGEPLMAKKDEKYRQQQIKEAFFTHILEKYAGEKGGRWLREMLKDSAPGCQLLMQQFGQDAEQLEELLKFILQAAEQLPVFEGKAERLPVFAACITGNPHFFDDGTAAGRLLLYFILYYFGEEEDAGSRPERRNRLLYMAGILNDDLSNFVLTYGLRGRKKDGSVHGGIEGFTRLHEPIQLTVYTLQGICALWGNKRVYVVENPAVFAMLIEKNSGISAVCTNGQLRLSTLVALDLLSEKSEFYYAGDFDPEGLLIAQKLKDRFGDKLHLWHYTIDYYEKMKSDVVLTPERMKKLEKVNCAGLMAVKEAIIRTERAGYQENVAWDIEENYL